MKKLLSISLTFLWMVLFICQSYAQSVFGIYDNQPTKLSVPDNGKMWIFDNPPLEYLNSEYAFTPTQEWLEDVRLSALRFGRGCSASFVSEDGLIMTNNHCTGRTRTLIARDGEDFTNRGFYAERLGDERRVDGIIVRQLILMEDVTIEVQKALGEGTTDEEKFQKKTDKILEIEERYNKETGLLCQVETFYNGGKFSLYGYRVYDDIRLVFLADPSVASYGGDFDNFTYPRYDLDCAFFRAYDKDGFPVKSEHYFKWSLNGAPKDDVVFTVGYPGSTQRLKTVAQLEYLRDIQYKNQYYLYDTFFKDLTMLQKKYPDKFDAMEAIKTRLGNTQKVYVGRMNGLNDKELMQRKKDFEQELVDAVNADPEMKKNYSHLWGAIKSLQQELHEIRPQLDIMTPRDFFIPIYFTVADSLIFLAEQLTLPAAERAGLFNDDEEIRKAMTEIFPIDYDPVIENARLKIMADYIIMNLGENSGLVQKMFGNKNGWEAAEYAISKSKIKDGETFQKFVRSEPEEILNSDDPFILFARMKKTELAKLQGRQTEIDNTEEVYENLLGQTLFKIYGTTFPPDANATLRISDGTLMGFEYNGTIAPVKTTYYGMYDRYYSYEGEYPFNLPEVWQNPPADFNMAAEYNFVSTNDIVGGNSGSAVINRSAEAIGVAFDGNIVSNVGNIIFVPSDNRCVSVSTQGMMEAFEHIYKVDRMVKELKNGKIVK